MSPSFVKILIFIIILAVVAFFIAAAFLRYAVKTVPGDKRVVVLRMGKSIGSRGPGNVILIPLIDSAVWVDLQKRYHFRFENLPGADGGDISCSVSLEGSVVDPVKSVVNVADLERGLSGVIE